MYAKLHKTDTRTILAVCDEDILGKTFREKGLKLEVTEHFFKGDKMDATALWALIRTEEPPSMNLVGKETIRFAIRHKLIDKENVALIQGIPHALIF